MELLQLPGMTQLPMIHREGPNTAGFNGIYVGGLQGVFCVASVRGATLIEYSYRGYINHYRAFSAHFNTE